MLPDAVGGLPRWLVLGVGLGLLGSVGVGGAFLVADRFLGSGRPAGGPGPTGRRQEFREYLRAIGEPFAEDHPVAEQVVAFYLPAREVAITFDARAYYRLRRTETTPILVEHEMPGHVLGARLPFETPTPEQYDDARQPAPTHAAYAELGLDVGAGPGAVTRAYRERVTDAHPDQGGDEAAFRRLREAYTTAKDHARGR